MGLAVQPVVFNSILMVFDLDNQNGVSCRRQKKNRRNIAMN